MRRLLVDLCGFGLLFGSVYLLPFNASIIIGFCIPLTIGYARGLVERRFLPKIPRWLAMLKWAVVVFASDIALCIPNSKSDPHDNFMTVFGAFFLIFMIPSLALGVGGFVAGLEFEKSRPAA